MRLRFLKVSGHLSHPIITTNINFNSWDDVFFDPVIANAILDRVLHHAHVVNITGKSYRLKKYTDQEEE